MRDHSSKWTSLTEKLKSPSWTRAGDILVENQDLENYGRFKKKNQVDETPRSPLGVHALSIYTDFIINTELNQVNLCS